ncbi:HAD family hydrolase [Thalassospira sp.]|uniref:HAD family hydrolase n=1 Tax=Thalassospira sp. TaxID=1912094 RepID=UPI003AA8B2EE
MTSQTNPVARHEAPYPSNARYDAVVFDLLTALIDSWSIWNSVAGSKEDGLKWRKEYLKLTYGAGKYRPYEDIVAEAAVNAGFPSSYAENLAARWGRLMPWPEVKNVLRQLAPATKLAVVTNCSIELGRKAALQTFDGFDVIVTAEEAGFYKPCREPYAMALDQLGSSPDRTLFVAGSASDVPGASALGMPVYWHNRINLPSINEVSPTFLERSLDRLVDIVLDTNRGVAASQGE